MVGGSGCVGGVGDGVERNDGGSGGNSWLVAEKRRGELRGEERREPVCGEPLRRLSMVSEGAGAYEEADRSLVRMAAELGAESNRSDVVRREADRLRVVDGVRDGGVTMDSGEK